MILTAILEGGNILAEAMKGGLDTSNNSAGSIDNTSGLLGLAGVAMGLIGKIDDPFIRSLSTALGVNAGVLGTVLGAIQLADAIRGYEAAVSGPATAAEREAALQNLGDKTAGVVASIGGAIAAVPGGQALGLAIWLGASLAQQLMNGNMARSYRIITDELRSLLGANGDHSYGIDPRVNQLYRTALFGRGRDPLVLDVGNGISAVGVDASKVQFDLANSGQKEAVGWITSGGFLVNTADGTVTSGAQLFGDARSLPDGTLAKDGFSALAPLDSNGDGHINSQDSAFGQLAVWTDANQDGVEQANEASTLSQLGIQDIDLTSAHSIFQNLGGDNMATGAATITWADGHKTQMMEANLVTNGFYTTFTDNLTLTTEQLALPLLQGSGRVRDTQQAAARSSTFTALLEEYAAAGTRAAQMALLPALVDAWAATSNFSALMDRNTYAANSVNYEYTFAGVEQHQRKDLGFDALISKSNWTDDYSKWVHMVGVLETFNGQTLFSSASSWMWGNRMLFSSLNPDGTTSAYSGSGAPAPSLLEPTVLQIALSTTQMSNLQQSYNALLQSIYGGLVLQTRLATYINAAWTQGGEGVSALLQSRYAQDSVNATADAVDLFRYGGSLLQRAGIQLAPQLSAMVADLAQRGLLTELAASDASIHFAGTGQPVATGLSAEINGLFVLSGADSDSLRAVAGQGSSGNIFFAGQGNISVDASAGTNQYFHGGTGQVSFLGGNGSNEFHAGSSTTIMDGHLGSSGIFMGGQGNDAMIGGGGLNEFECQAGNDSIVTAAYSTNIVDAGVGDDTIKLGYMSSKNTVDGGAGNDTITLDPYAGYVGGNDITGGAGDDTITLGYYSTKLHFNLGDGHDTVINGYNSGGKTLVFGAGIAASDISATRVGNDMVLNVGAGGDSITVTNWFLGDQYRLRNFAFSDGSTLDTANWVATYAVSGASGVTHVQSFTGFSDQPLTDVVSFKEASSRQLWFERQQDDLFVSVIGTQNAVDFTDWYGTSAQQSLQLHAADGLSLNGSQVDSLVQAMAQFSAPSAGQTTLPPELQDKLTPVIAANWH